MIFNRLLRRIRGSATPAHDGIDRVFDLTWSIPQEYGGLTKVMLRRSRTFVTQLGRSVDVLTLDYRLDVDEARADCVRAVNSSTACACAMPGTRWRRTIDGS